MRPFFFSSLIAIGTTTVAQSGRSTGTELWVTYMENLNLAFNGPPSFELVVSSDANTSGEVQVPYSGFTIPFTVMAGHDTVITLPNNIYYPEGDEDVFNSGLRVVAEAPVSVYAYHHRSYFSEASMALPIEGLGIDHLVIAHTDVSGNSPSELVVMATEDATTIEITPSALTVGFRPPGLPFTVMLNTGQVFQLQAFGDLTGTRVRSVDGQKRLAVFAGARQAWVGCGMGADDHLYQAIPPLSEWGQRFIVVPFKDRGGDPFRLFSATDGNQVIVGGLPAIMLDSGQYVDQVLTQPTLVQASDPLAVAQFNESQ
ncbi:MAG TPA: IgGFc-binding protein, partial [Flavobacteriales bacterium]|nr:IgGFc-binding protein [Flavobacteriales bacterium]